MQAVVHAHEREHCVFMLAPLYIQCSSVCPLLYVLYIIFICFVWGLCPCARNHNWLLHPAPTSAHIVFTLCNLRWCVFACHQLATYTHSGYHLRLALVVYFLLLYHELALQLSLYYIVRHIYAYAPIYGDLQVVYRCGQVHN